MSVKHSEQQRKQKNSVPLYLCVETIANSPIRESRKKERFARRPLVITEGASFLLSWIFFCLFVSALALFLFSYFFFILFYFIVSSIQNNRENKKTLYLCISVLKSSSALGYSSLASPKIGCTSAKQNKKMTFCFALRSVCTTFGFAEGTLARKSQNKIWLFPRLFVFGFAEDRLHLGKAKQKNDFLFCIALGLHYLCALLSVIHKYLYRLL